MDNPKQLRPTAGAFLHPLCGDTVRFRDAAGIVCTMRVTGTSDPRIVRDPKLRLVSGITHDGRYVGTYITELLP